MNQSRRTSLLAGGALLGFAANSLLCRAALGGTAIDFATFTSVRLVSGAVVLSLIAWRAGGRPLGGGSWLSGLALFAYAAAFSLAYTRLGAGPGALILFGAVQATMIGWGIARGQRPTAREGLGLVAALAGLALLTVRGARAPDPVGAVLMAVAGAAWGIYTLRGRGSSRPVEDTAGNFARSLPATLVLTAIASSGIRVSTPGLGLAIASGALASGLGYALWYGALPHLPPARAAILQLSVPVLAAAGAVALLGERPTMRFAAASLLVLGGVGLAVARRRT